MIDAKYNVKQDMIELVGEFTLHWNLFERYYCERKANPKVIKKLDLSNYGTELKRYANAFRENLQYWMYHSDKNPVSEDMVKFVLYHADNPHKQPEDLNRVTAYLREERDDINSCLLCVERIRNNLFHGEKVVDTLSTQREILQSANNLLSYLTSKERITDYELNMKK